MSSLAWPISIAVLSLAVIALLIIVVVLVCKAKASPENIKKDSNPLYGTREEQNRNPQPTIEEHYDYMEQ